MKSSFCRLLPTTAPLIAALLVACQPKGEQAGAEPSPSAAAGAAPGALVPLPNYEGSVPPLTQATMIRMRTTAGEITIAVYPEAAPSAARRFVELVQSGFYDDTPISRVVPGFVAQFGVNWREPHRSWKERNLTMIRRSSRSRAARSHSRKPARTRTPRKCSSIMLRTIASPSRATTSPFGRVVSGMDVVDRFVQVGDPSGGLDQGRLWADGAAYLDSLAIQPTMIESAAVER
jgi:cyclophilin family peptidyl-prolyl cis-trans isomerase